MHTLTPSVKIKKAGTSMVAQWLAITCQYSGHRFDPWSRKTLHAMGQLSPRVTTTKAINPRACALQQEKPPQQRVAPTCPNQRKPTHSIEDSV